MIRSTDDKNNLSDAERVALACRDAGEQAIVRAEQTRTPIIIWRDGKVIHQTAAEARSEWNKSRALMQGLDRQVET